MALNDRIGDKRNCFCSQDTSLSEQINCDTIELKSGSRIFYQFNCDSSWLTFQNRTGLNTVLFSLDTALIGLTYKLAWHVERDYEHYVLFVARATSGLPTTLVYQLLDKQSSSVTEEFGQVVYCETSSSCDFLLYVPDSADDHLRLRLLPDGEEFRVQLPQKLSELHRSVYIESQFSEPKIRGQVYTFEYNYVDEKTGEEKSSSVSVDMSRHCK
jgi:hypothetical protein